MLINQHFRVPRVARVRGSKVPVAPVLLRWLHASARKRSGGPFRNPRKQSFSMGSCPKKYSCVRGKMVRWTILGPPIAKQFGVFEPLTAQKQKEMLFASLFVFSTCVRGFEPPTFWSVAKRSIQLS